MAFALYHSVCPASIREILLDLHFAASTTSPPPVPTTTSPLQGNFGICQMCNFDRHTVQVKKRLALPGALHATVCVSLFLVCNRHWLNRVPGSVIEPGGCLSTLHSCSDSGYAELPLTQLGAPVIYVCMCVLCCYICLI
jgi:hypothetical protein